MRKRALQCLAALALFLPAASQSSQPARSAKDKPASTQGIEKPDWFPVIERQFQLEKSNEIRVLVEFKRPAATGASRVERPANAGGTEGPLAKEKAENIAARTPLETRLEGMGIKILQRYDYLPFLLVAIKSADMEVLSNLPEIISVSPNRESTTGSGKGSKSSTAPGPGSISTVGTGAEFERPQLSVSTNAIGARSAWARGFDGDEQVIAVLDDGIYRNHEMFQGDGVITEACFSGASSGQSLCPGGVTEVKGQVGAASLCSGGNNVCEHGTHVASIAMGYTTPWTDNSTNDANPHLGVAPLAYVLPIQVFKRNTTGCTGGSASCITSSTSDELAALNYLIDVVNQKLLPSPKQLVAVNMSLGSDQKLEDYCYGHPLRSAIILLRQLGVLTAIASGNESGAGTISAPACIKEAISVDATTRDHTDAVPYSNTAFTNDIMAPGGKSGGAIISAGTSSPTSYVGFYGTSMAAPHVAGAIAILRSKMPNATADQVEWAFKKSVSKYFFFGATPRLWPTGLIDVNAALDVLGQPPILGAPIAGYFPSSYAGGFNYLRILNPGSSTGTVNLTLVRDDTGEAVGSYLQQVPGHAAIQVQIATLQSNIGGKAANIPATTTLTVYFDASFYGHAQNILWNASAQSLTNITSCADPLPDPNRVLGNIHTALINDSYPSAIRVHNKGSIGARAVFDAYNAGTGALIGVWTTPDVIAPAMTKTYSAMSAFADLKFTPDANTYHAVFILRAFQTFVIGHVVNNVAANLITDMTTKCRI